MLRALREARQTVVLLVSLLISILSGMLTNLGGRFAFTPPEQIILGGLVFCGLQLVEVAWLANKVAARERQEEELWLLRESIDGELLNVSRCFVRVAREAYGENDLFVAHFRREIHQLAESIGEVAERRQLRVQADHFLTVDNVLDAFQGDAERIWRYTWTVEGEHRLFDELAWKRYFEKTAAMVERGEIKEVRTLLVIEKQEALESPRMRRLLDFFHTNKGFRCCIANRNDVRLLCNDNSGMTNCIEFGIYGDRLLFLTEQYEPQVRGVFTKDPGTIKHYCKLFDSMWSSASVASANPSTATARVTLAELYKFDETAGA